MGSVRIASKGTKGDTDMNNALTITFALQAFVTLFVIMDPPGVIPIFLSIVKNLDNGARKRAAVLAATTSLSIITLFAIFGRFILNYLNVSMEALQASGGLLLLYTSLQLLTGKTSEEVDSSDATVALVPVGTPLLAGPAAIVATMIFVDKASGTSDLVGLAAAIIAVHICILISLIASTQIFRVLKEAGVTLLARIAGLLLAAIAVQMIADAIKVFMA